MNADSGLLGGRGEREREDKDGNNDFAFRMDSLDMGLEDFEIIYKIYLSVMIY